MQDIQQLSQLLPKNRTNIHHQDRGEYKRVIYEEIKLDQLKNNNNNLGVIEEPINDTSSSYDKKLQTVAGKVRIVVKVKIK